VRPGGFVARFAGRRASWFAPALALEVALPTIAMGFYSDDWTQLASFDGRGPSPHPTFDLYDFASPDTGVARAIARGPFPWFTDPAIKIHFLRPLTSLVTALDHALFGLAPLGYHLDAIAWYVACAALVGWVLRRLLPSSPAVANVAACLWAIDEAHQQPVGWLASRHVEVGGLFALAALGLHVAWRRDGLSAGRWLAPIAFALALAGSESGLAALAFVLAFEIFERAGTLRRRAQAALEATLPWLALLGVYAVIYKGLGCGAAHNGAYFDPAVHPLRFLAAVALRYPLLVGDALLNVPSDLSNILPRAPFYVAAAIGVALYAGLFRAIRGELTIEERRALALLGLGAAASLFVSLGAFPGGRVLFLPSLFTSTLFALVLLRARGAASGSRALRRVGFVVTLVFHVVLAPLVFVVDSLGTGAMARRAEGATDALVAEGIVGRRVVLVAGSDPFTSLYPMSVLAARHEPLARTWHILSMAKATHRITRVDARTLRVEILGGRMFEGAFETVVRSPREAPLEPGDRVALEGAVVTVLASDHGAPTALEYAMDRSLDDDDVRVVTWQDGAPRRVDLPIGGAEEIAWSPGPTGLF
jgi:hypothetical protein